MGAGLWSAELAIKTLDFRTSRQLCGEDYNVVLFVGFTNLRTLEILTQWIKGFFPSLFNFFVDLLFLCLGTKINIL